MILIISNNYDASTTDVIEQLQILNKKWIRINEDDILNVIFLGKNIKFSVGEVVFYLNDVQSVWYRRGFLNINWDYFIEEKRIQRILETEKNKLINYIYYKLNQNRHINSFFNADVNKLIVSSIAETLNLKVTNDFVFSELHGFQKNELKKYISKTISGDDMMSYDNFTVFNYTTIIDFEKIKLTTFMPSLVQEYIEKKYELRIFYINGKFFSMAIFSQNDNQTNIDFRNYNHIKPNRRVPFKVPAAVEYKLDLLMKKLNINCGSIDMIVNLQNDYIFLEVNPVGQFGMVSYPCNYNLEKIIANYL